MEGDEWSKGHATEDALTRESIVKYSYVADLF